MTMTRMTMAGPPFLLGFDEIEMALGRIVQTGKSGKTGADGYPPYNVERLRADAERPERLRISLAVAGFCADQLEITLEDGQLVIRGRQVEEEARGPREYLHRGIAARAFQRAFLLAEGMEALGAELDRGVLTIDLVRPQPRRASRRIAIAARA